MGQGPLMAPLHVNANQTNRRQNRNENFLSVFFGAVLFWKLEQAQIYSIYAYILRIRILSILRTLR